MPRRVGPELSSAIRQVQQQARALLNQVRKQIRVKENDLERLRAEAQRLGMLAGQASASRHLGGNSGRTDWRAILAHLPKQFKAANIRAVRGLHDKRPSEIFAAITRWIEAGVVKRKARGVYERID
jgi:ABC-type phosphate transport system auxiliary subunit